MNKKHFLAALGVICLPVQLLRYFELSSILNLAGNANKARAGVWASELSKGTISYVF